MYLGIIPARSGSKGFPHKNIAKVNGTTLLEYAVKSGVACPLIDSVVVSSDSLSYLALGHQAGAIDCGIRPEELSGDSALTVDVLLELLDRPKFKKVKAFVLLQPTSPIRSAIEVTQALKTCIESGDSVVSVSKIEDPHPMKTKKIVGHAVKSFIEGASSELPRQSLEAAYELTGAIYACSRETLFNRRSLFSETTRPLIQQQFVNIDSERDFNYLRFLVAEGVVSLE